ncbi:hypothetical protein FPE07_002103 [Salmonella enterica subsp. enterica serovar Braenderup]|nr:hypothetical protein [Salmonella enterica]ECK0504350.1 hypothetical protein [Salmonella enterica subsp. enterica serovar Goldcoast]EDQ8520786.1 hypothetical protein [Salmonella enterica subsp. enterica serovar Braenderup]EDV1333177.1 hypothetical protein [Salmonella enterica subsp. enterica serovar Mbandaka]EEK7059793.1 hypothetical protein [Salmonella enterica subsp. enterica serovar Tennessee]OUK68622.1 hypothetical protein BZY52_27345 [Enterobacter hormaechei]HBX6254008.1 hypothetical p
MTQYGRGRRNSGWRNTHGRFYYSLIVSVYTFRDQINQMKIFKAGRGVCQGKQRLTINETETGSIMD